MSGLTAWLVQRLTALYLLFYVIFLIISWKITPSDYLSWIHWFASPVIFFINLLAILAVIFHSWIGLWTVATDYLNKPAWLALVAKLVILGLLAIYSFIALFLLIKLSWGHFFFL